MMRSMRRLSAALAFLTRLFPLTNAHAADPAAIDAVSRGLAPGALKPRSDHRSNPEEAP